MNPVTYNEFWFWYFVVPVLFLGVVWTFLLALFVYVGFGVKKALVGIYQKLGRIEEHFSYFNYGARRAGK